MHGFFGTVIGISEAFKNAFQSGILLIEAPSERTVSALMVWTLALNTFLGVFEQNLLTQVESQSNEDLLINFQASSPANDPISRAIERSGKSVLDAVHSLVERQSQLWESALVNAQSQWNNAAIQTASTVHTEFENAVSQSLLEWRKSHLAISEDAEQRWHNRWEQLQIALTDNARQMHAQQSELVRHTEVLNKAVAATAEVLKLEDALNRQVMRRRHDEITV